MVTEEKSLKHNFFKQFDSSEEVWLKFDCMVFWSRGAMMYIKRALEKKFLSIAGEYSCVLVTGMRRSGKTTMLGHLMGKGRTVVTLDALDERCLAQNDPQMFFQLQRNHQVSCRGSSRHRT